MSDDARVELRDLPPVPPVDWPERLSQTLARYLNRCPRAAYLYVATGGAAPTHEMDRGSLTHACLERMMVDWIQHGRYDVAGQAGDEALSSLTAELVREVGREHPDLWVPHEQRDVARLCVFHAAVGLDVDPEHVAGIERKFLLELDCGWTVSGKIDLATMPGATLGQVDDYKTQLHVPPADEWDSYQAKLYACLLIWGRPVERVECPACTPPLGFVSREACGTCGGRGTVEEAGEPIGGHLTHVRGRELYPRFDPRKRSDGKLAYNERVWTRLELQEFMADLEDAGEALSGMLQTWKFPARYGTKACTECPAEALCPIPRGYRRFAGHIRAEDEAREAWAWVQRMKKLVSITEAEVKEFAAVNAIGVRVGDEIWEHSLTEQRKLKTRSGRADWDGLEEAIESSFESGEKLDLRESGWLKVSNVSTFKKSKAPVEAPKSATTQEVEKDGRSDDERRDEQFGADAPY